MIQCLVSTIIFLLLMGSTSQIAAESALPGMIGQARLVYTTSSGAPAPGLDNGSMRFLPDRVSSPPAGAAGWYEVQLNLKAAPNGTWAVYFPEAAVNAAIFLNGRLLGQGVRYGSRKLPLVTRPLYLKIPTGLLRAGINTLYIALRPLPSAPIFLSRIHIGPVSALKGAFEHRMFWRVNIPTAVQVTTMVIGLCLMALWVRHRQRSHYFWLAAATFFWVIHDIDLIGDAAWRNHWAIGIGLIGFTACFMMFVHRYCGIRKPMWERAVVLTVVFVLILMAVLPPGTLWYLSAWLLQPGLVAVAIYSAWIIWRHYYKFRTPVNVLMMIVVTAIAIFAFREWLITIRWIDLESYSLLYLGIPMLQLAAGITLANQYVSTLREAQVLNEELGRRVRLRTCELGEQHERLRALERAQVLAAERTRMLRDMHDGVGGQLVSALVMLEGGQHTHQEIAGLLRDTLDELRLVIESIDPAHDDLCTALASLRPRIEACLESKGITLQWRLASLPSNITLGPQQALQVLRIVQEAITNVVKHACARTVTISGYVDTVDQDSGGVIIDITDDGVGIKLSPPSGRGMKTMVSRAEDIGGTLDIVSTDKGTKIKLRIPLKMPRTLTE